MSFTQGPVPTVARTAAGQYSFSIAGLGGGCPLPALTPLSNADFQISWSGGACGGGTFTSTIFTSDGADHFWSYLFVGVEAGSSARAGGSTALPTVG